MKRNISLILLTLFVTSCSSLNKIKDSYINHLANDTVTGRILLKPFMDSKETQQSVVNVSNLTSHSKLNSNDVIINEYGQPVQLRPDFGGVEGENLNVKRNAYGLGVHMDQYGRPVREYPTYP